jgi:putative endonuclease
MLRCGDGSLYTGVTKDIDRRLAAHQRGTASKYTRTRRPVSLACFEPAIGRAEALKREAAIKRLSRKAKLALIEARQSAE